MHPRATHFILILCMLYFPQEAFNQAIGHTTHTYLDETRNNRQIQTEIYYPATAQGENTEIIPGAFPLIVFGHGFLMTWSAYENIWSVLVPQGYIVAFPTTESGFAPSHMNFGLDLKFLASIIKSAGADPVIPASSLANTSAIMGHSMGGGSAFLAANQNTSVTTLVTFAAANTNPSSIIGAQDVSIPTLLFSGVHDCITPPEQHQDIMFDSTSALLKTQVYIKGGSHCYFANDNLFCSIGETTCTPPPSITREEQHETTGALLLQWLNYFLRDNCDEANAFQNSLLNNSKITFRQSQAVACTPSKVDEKNTESGIRIYPNPNGGEFSIKASFDIDEIRVTDSKGRTVATITEPGRNGNLNLKHLHPGTYFVKLIGKNKESYIEKIIIQ